MFFIINNGELKGMCDKPRYVKSNKGIYIECTKEEAECVAIGGTAYDLSETIVSESDSAEYAFRESKKLDNASANIDDLQELVIGMEYDSIIDGLED